MAKFTDEEDRNTKIGCAILIVLFVLLVRACAFLDEKSDEDKKTVITAEQQAQKDAEAKELHERHNAEQRAAQEAKKAAQNNAPVFTKEIITANVKAAIPDSKNLSVMIYDTNIFDVNFDLERAGVSEMQARSIAVKAIKDVIAANNGCQFNVVGVIVTSKKAPVCMVTFADNHYVSVINGKREEFTP